MMFFSGSRIPAAALMIILACTLSACSGDKGDKKDETEIEETELTILFTSDLHGMIRSCGCSTQDMGGLGRMATFVEKTRLGEDHVIVLSCGDDFSMELSFSQKEADLIMDCYQLMKLDALTPGEIEFIFGLDYLVEISAATSQRVLVANLFYTGTGERVFSPPYIVKELDTGLRVGITGVLDETIKFPGYIDNSKFRLEPAAETLETLVSSMKNEADFLVLLSHMGVEGTRALLEQVPGFDIAIIGHKYPRIDTLEKVGETVLLGSGSKGKCMGKLEMVFSKDREVKFSRTMIVPLKNDIKIHQGVVEIFRSHDIELTDKKEKSKRKSWR